MACQNCHQTTPLNKDKCLHCKTELVKPLWYVPEDSAIHDSAIKIAGMRAAGMTSEEIGAVLHIKPRTVRQYMWFAGKNGWIDFDDPRDEVEYRLIPKAVRVLHEGLDDDTRNEKTGVKVKQVIAMKVGGDYVQSLVAAPTQGTGPQTMIAVKIEMPQGPVPQIREGTTGGQPAYIEGEVAK